MTQKTKKRPSEIRQRFIGEETKTCEATAGFGQAYPSPTLEERLERLEQTSRLHEQPRAK